jgi:hypothetical protein
MTPLPASDPRGSVSIPNFLFVIHVTVCSPAFSACAAADAQGRGFVRGRGRGGRGRGGERLDRHSATGKTYVLSL